jgi:hypothetical protein
MISPRSFQRGFFLSALMIAGVITTVLPMNAQAVPAFARQVGVECSACHFQHYPKLKGFGRVFKSNGFSQSSQSLLESSRLSIPPFLNVSFFVKTRVVDTDESDATLAFPDEAALLFGGRLAEGIGGLVEMGDAILSYKVSFTMPTTTGVTYGLTTFATDGLGAAYGFELLNTGAVRNIRPFERSSKPSLGANGLDLSGSATGIAFHAAHANWFAATTFFVPDDSQTGATEMDTGADLSKYFRAAWMPRFGGFDTGLGVGKFAGESEATSTSTSLREKLRTNAWFVDFQLQGEVASKELGVYVLYAKGDDDTDGIFSAGNADAPRAWGVDVEYDVIPNLAVLLTGGRYDDGGDGSSLRSYGIGLYWKIDQNITLQPMYESFSGDQSTIDKRTTLQLEAAF